MKTKPLVIKSELSQEFQDYLIEMRKMRLSVSRQMLADIDKTKNHLISNGYLDDGYEPTDDEVRAELKTRIALLEDRLDNPGTIYEDEMDFLREELGAE